MICNSDKSKCSGCTSCANACPKGCIKMELDNEGFYYPVIDTNECVNCNLCEKVCPYIHELDNRSEKMIVYGAQNTDDDSRKTSTSGGMFAVIANYIIAKNGVVYGAGYDDNMHVLHKRVDTTEDIRNLQGSKYVQSDLGNTFSEIKELLSDNKYVFFTGTPCQVEGLLYYLNGKDTSKLITADIKCYGVPSSELFDKFQNYLSGYYGSKVKEFYFRDKKYGYSGVNVKAVLENGKIIEDKLAIKTYSKTMFTKVGLRRSCYNCVFTSRNKLSDFTLGDIWNIKDFDRHLDDEKGTTCVEINSEKGLNLFNEIKEGGNIRTVKIAELEKEELKNYKSKLQRSYSLNEERRNAFFSDMNKMPYSQLMDKHFKDTWKNKIDNIGKPLINLLPGAKFVFRAKKLKKAKVDYNL